MYDRIWEIVNVQQHLTVFANFICKFGDLNMADLFRDIVLPAFTDDTLVREAYGSSFHLLDVQLLPSLVPDRCEPAITGQFVRDHFLRRTQVLNYKTGTLVADEAMLQTSPSAFFVLLARDHRLVYFAETQHAPDLKLFASTMERFLTQKYHAYIDRLYDEAREVGERVTKKNLRAKIEPPTLELVPLTSKDELEAFIARYQKLQRVDITVHRKNDEISTAALIKNAEAYNELLRGQRTKISTSDSAGLDKEGTTQALKEVTDGANETIRLFGQDENGDRLVGDNDQFSVRVKIEHLAGNARQKAGILFAKFQDMVIQGLIQRPATEDAAAAALAEAMVDDG
jgi:hypothetical protein